MHKIIHPLSAYLIKNQYIGVITLCISVFIPILLIYHHYQIDFSAYYSAAKVLVQGGNPYLDSFTGSDGVQFVHSQFLQPPLVAAIFWPFSLLPYQIAKTLWFLVQIPLIAGILFFSAASPTSQRKIIYQMSMLVAANFIFFWPLYTLFERGQTDLVVLFWICLGYYLWKRGHPAATGFVILIAGLFKLPAAFLLIVPIATRGVKPVIGASLAFALILGTSLLINGVEINRQYFIEYLPEIIQSGTITTEIGPYDVKPGERVIWDGQSYKTAAGFQAYNGSMIRMIGNQSGETNRGLLSLAAFSLTSIFILAFLQVDRSDQAAKLAWVFALLSTLLFHPLTWVMNYVWLLPVVIIGFSLLRSNQPSSFLCVLSFIGLAGLSLICIGEPIFLQINRWLDPFRVHFAGQIVSLWFNDMLTNRIWLGGSLLWLITLAIILVNIGSTPLVYRIRKILSLH